MSSIYQRRHFVHPGAAIKLVCPLEPGSNPPPLVAWQREGESIHPGWDRYKVQEEGRVLRIIGVEWEDGGTFVCRVTNGFGSVDVTHLLYVHGRCSGQNRFLIRIMVTILPNGIQSNHIISYMTGNELG